MAPGLNVVLVTVTLAAGLSVTVIPATCTVPVLVTVPLKFTSISSTVPTGTTATVHVFVMLKLAAGGAQTEASIGVGQAPHAACPVPPESVQRVTALLLTSVASTKTL